jgi:hypothetical protein
MDKVQKPSDSECYTPSSKPFRFNGVCFFLPSPEDGTKSSFRNVVLSSYLELRTMDNVQKCNDSKHLCLSSDWG